MREIVDSTLTTLSRTHALLFGIPLKRMTGCVVVWCQNANGQILGWASQKEKL